MNSSPSILQRKLQYEQFTRYAIRSDYFIKLAKNNKSYRHVIRFIFHFVLFLTLIGIMKLSFTSSRIFGSFIYPCYLFFQGLLIAGFMIHSHELSHHHIKIKWLNNTLGIISGLVCFINFYSFQYAHRFHHKNIGNLDAPEAGAPVSVTGQKYIKHEDKLHKMMAKLLRFSKLIWFLTSWPLFIFYGDYSSWLLPFCHKDKINRASMVVFSILIMVNALLLVMFQFDYIFFYFLPVLFAGNRILVITYMHHAHEDTIFFKKEHHNFYNVIMSTTDRDFGSVVNFFMMNNGYHIAHHLNPRIAYYDLKKASEYLRKIMPVDLSYNFYNNCRFYHDFIQSTYERRLDSDFEFYQLTFLNTRETANAL